MGNTIEWVDALEKRVTYGRKTEICGFGAERSFYGVSAVRGVWDQPKERAQVLGAIRGRKDGGDEITRYKTEDNMLRYWVLHHIQNTMPLATGISRVDVE